MDKVEQDNLLEKVRLEREELRILLKHPAWVRLVKIYQVQSDRREKELIRKPISSMDDALLRNVQKGIVIGLKIAAQLPYQIYDKRVEDFQQLIEEIQNAEPESNSE